MSQNLEPNPHADWWASLNHGGLLIAPAKVDAFFPHLPPSLPSPVLEKLRTGRDNLLNNPGADLSALLTTVLEEVLELRGIWLRGSQVSERWSVKAITREILRPRRVWLGLHGAVLPVFVTDETQEDDIRPTHQVGPGSSQGRRSKEVARIGVGRGRRAVARVLEWLRRGRLEERRDKSRGAATELHPHPSIALLTNGRQWRLIHAGPDYEAWCEWDISLWFQEGGPSPQLTAMRQLLSYKALTPPAAGRLSPLLEAIQASRKGQAELSEALGERVRQAVELLIQASSPVLQRLEASGQATLSRRDLYIGATRMLMRCVVLLFAESRQDLLPITHASYYASYSLQGLREQLDRQSGGRAAERLRYSHSAWPRLLSLCRLVYAGSAHPELPVPRYGGGLFRPGDPSSESPVSRAVAVFEDGQNEISDATVHQLLELLTRCRIRVRQGRSSRTVDAPVDFSDLSSEYIGILYEGLLDYELRAAEANNPIVFLNVGDQPALPFMDLNNMNDKELARLFESLKKGSRDEEGEAPEEATDEAEAGDAAGESPEGEGEEEGAAPETADQDTLRAVRAVVQDWAERAVKATGLVKPPRKNDPRATDVWHEEVARAGRQLVKRIILPGEYFLIRWGGTRKGAGTFYTRPQLAGPTLRRTLEPLCYERVEGQPVPRKPEALMALKVCDPAMGSGSFLVGALRFLGQALFESLVHHGWLEQTADGVRGRLDETKAPGWFRECLKDALTHDEDSERRLRARLRRLVVERCLYGVDLDPLAVELARVSLWVETLEKDLPFEFLDHKLKCGNSLVGTWLDTFPHYPLLAWERKGGDEGHKNGVHFQEGTWTKALKEQRERVRQRMVALLQKQVMLEDDGKSFRLLEGHASALASLEQMHNLPVDNIDDRETLYSQFFIDRGEAHPSAYIRLKQAFDTWCALWFWPADGESLEQAPLPDSLGEPSPAALRMVHGLTETHRFFHWELEFPDVFSKKGAGFDAVVGNPPWETQKPNSMEFFANLDPMYRTYGKQEALAKQAALFQRAEHEASWLRYNGRFKALSNWFRSAALPCGDPEQKEGVSFSLARGAKENAELHAVWRKRRNPKDQRDSHADLPHPFRHQGSADINTYKLFLELGHALLRQDGRMSLIIPSGLYTDKGAGDLRTLFTHHCDWSHLYVFQNERFVFAGIDHRFKMAIPTFCKGGKTEAIRTRFRVGPGDSPEAHELEEDILAEDRFLSISLKSLEKLSPKTQAILEIRSEKDRDILEKLYQNGVLLGDQGPEGWGITYAREFDMTNDSRLFPPRPQWEAKGYRPDEYGHWLKGPWEAYAGPRGILERKEGLILSPDGTLALGADQVEGVALPLYQGVMVNQFDFSSKLWISGTGLRAVWEPCLWSSKNIGSQFLLSAKDYGTFRQGAAGNKIAFRDIARSTDERTFIGAVLPDMPCGNVLGVLRSPRPRFWQMIATLNSLPFDWSARQRIGGTHLNLFLIEELPILTEASLRDAPSLEGLVASICFASVQLSDEWTRIASYGSRSHPWRQLWAVTGHERLRLRCILDAVVAELYGLDEGDLAWILRDCDHPVSSVSSTEISRTFDPKGFWRVDREKPPELRHPVLTQVAFRDLKARGLEAFLAQNGGEGWMLPERLCLAAFDLGHDGRAKEDQPVAEALGPRFLAWQLEQGVEESWEECRRHAALIQRIRGQGAEADAGGSDRSAGPVTEVAPDRAASLEKKADRAVAQLTLDGREEKVQPEVTQLGLFAGLGKKRR